MRLKDFMMTSCCTCLQLLALATIATGAWFALYVKDFVAIVEVYVSDMCTYVHIIPRVFRSLQMRDVFCGYSALGVYLLLPGRLAMPYMV